MGLKSKAAAGNVFTARDPAYIRCQTTIHNRISGATALVIYHICRFVSSLPLWYRFYAVLSAKAQVIPFDFVTRVWFRICGQPARVFVFSRYYAGLQRGFYPCLFWEIFLSFSKPKRY